MRYRHKGVQPSSVLLRKRAHEQNEEHLRAGKHHKKEEQHLVACEAREQKIADILERAARIEKRQRKIEQEIKTRSMKHQWRTIMRQANLYREWLQTVYPTMFAHRCIEVADGNHASFRKAFEHWKENHYRRCCFIPHLWTWDKTLTKHWGSISICIRGQGVVQVKKVYCSPWFDRLLSDYASPPVGSKKDARQTLRTLLEKCVPHSSQFFFWRF